MHKWMDILWIYLPKYDDVIDIPGYQYQTDSSVDFTLQTSHIACSTYHYEVMRYAFGRYPTLVMPLLIRSDADNKAYYTSDIGTYLRSSRPTNDR